MHAISLASDAVANTRRPKIAQKKTVNSMHGLLQHGSNEEQPQISLKKESHCASKLSKNYKLKRDPNTKARTRRFEI